MGWYYREPRTQQERRANGNREYRRVEIEVEPTAQTEAERAHSPCAAFGAGHHKHRGLRRAALLGQPTPWRPRLLRG